MKVLKDLLLRAARPVLIPFSFLLLLPVSATLNAMPVFINELHYDNVGADVGEGVELAGEAGLDLAGWSLWFYNGGTGSSYATLPLSGVFMDMQQGYGVQSFFLAGIQNGAPDGIALVDAANLVQQFISYEGRFRALTGSAANLLSDPIGVSESAQTPVGYSLQLAGHGSGPSDFYWQLIRSSFGAINESQAFTGQTVVAVPVGSSSGLLICGLAGLWCRRVLI